MSYSKTIASGSRDLSNLSLNFPIFKFFGQVVNILINVVGFHFLMKILEKYFTTHGTSVQNVFLSSIGKADIYELDVFLKNTVRILIPQSYLEVSKQ